MVRQKVFVELLSRKHNNHLCVVFRLNTSSTLSVYRVSTLNSNTVVMMGQMQERVKIDQYSVQRVKLLLYSEGVITYYLGVDHRGYYTEPGQGLT